MSKMKTSDIWPKGYKLTFDYCPSNTSADETFGFIFSSSEPCIFICDVVNNHDRMVEDVADLRKGLEIMIEQFESDHNCEYEYNIIRWNKDLIAKLNQEGGE